MLLTPRSDLVNAPAEWFWLQRGWWRGTADPGKPMAAYKPKIALDLTEDNAFKILPGDGTTNPPEDPAISDPKTDDSVLAQSVARHLRHSRQRRRAPRRLPQALHGAGELEPRPGFDLRQVREPRQRQRPPLHGRQALRRRQIVRDDLGGILTPGSQHVLTTEIWGAAPPLGTMTPAWISYLPDPDTADDARTVGTSPPIT